MILVLVLVAAHATAGVLPYPGVVVTAEFKTSDGRRCALAMWDGSAVDRRLLTDAERKELVNLLKEVQQRCRMATYRASSCPCSGATWSSQSHPARRGSCR